VFATIAVSFVLTLLLDRRGRARQDAAAAEAVATPAAEPVPARGPPRGGGSPPPPPPRRRALDQA
jgi:hypothetical protein